MTGALCPGPSHQPIEGEDVGEERYGAGLDVGVFERDLDNG